MSGCREGRGVRMRHKENTLLIVFRHARGLKRWQTPQCVDCRDYKHSDKHKDEDKHTDEDKHKDEDKYKENKRSCIKKMAV